MAVQSRNESLREFGIVRKSDTEFPKVGSARKNKAHKVRTVWRSEPSLVVESKTAVSVDEQAA